MEQRDGIRQLKGGGNLQVRWDCNRCQSFLPISGLDVLAAIRQNEKLDGIPTAVVTSPAPAALTPLMRQVNTAKGSRA